jgi:hypothetical protein
MTACGVAVAALIGVIVFISLSSSWGSGSPDYSLHHANLASSENGLPFGGDEADLKRRGGGRSTAETVAAFPPVLAAFVCNLRMHGNNERTPGKPVSAMSQ